MGFQVAKAVAPEAVSRARARPCGREGAAWAAVDGEAECGGAGDDGDSGTYGQVEGAVADVAGDLVLEAGEPFGVVDEGLGADGVELVHVDVEADRRDMAAQFEGSERRDVDLRAAGEGGAQGHGGVHGADRGAYVPHDQQAQPGPDQRDHDQAEGRFKGLARSAIE